MKNILVIVDGRDGKAFLQRLSISKTQNKYYIVHFDENILPEARSDSCLLYKFDPTSFSKLSKLLNQIDFFEAFLILPNKNDMLETYKNIRYLHKDLKIVMLDKWQLELDDEYINKVDATDIVVNRVINFLPNIPIYAKEIGLGKGEIAQIQIPPTSNFAYKHIGALTQNRWKVAAIYRQETLHIPTDNFMLLPNDTIVIVGNPAVVQSVYMNINQNYGQFPKPYGENIYTFIDMQRLSDKDIDSLVNDAFLLFSKLNTTKLYIRVVNPRLSKAYEKLKSYKNSNIIIFINYEEVKQDEILNLDVKKFDIGLIISDPKTFRKNIKEFYELKLPIFKTSHDGFFNLKESVVLSSNSKDIEAISSVIFDVSTQLELNISLYEFEGIEKEENDKITEHFKSLSRLFEREVNIVKLEKNPILKLEDKKDFLQFVSFTQKLVDINFLDKIFSTELEDHFYKLSNSYQLYIPKL